MTTLDKCAECEGEIILLPCPFCGQAVTVRWNSMTGEHYISHTDRNGKCPQRPFYGRADQWNERVMENRLRSEIDAVRGVMASKNEQIERLCAQYRELAVRADKAMENARQAENEIAGLREELAATQAAGRAKTNRIEELLRTIELMRIEIIQWIEAGNAGVKVIREQRDEIERLHRSAR